jgi:purine-nucleoside phosphorylase
MLFIPLGEEFDVVVSTLQDLGAKFGKSLTRQDEYVLCDYHVQALKRDIDLHLVAMDPSNRQAMGNIISSARVAGQLFHIQPRHVMLVGLAGSLDAGNVRLGDVVVSNSAKYLRPDKCVTIDDTLAFANGHALRSSPYPKSGDKIQVHEMKKAGSQSVFRLRRDHVRYQPSETKMQPYALAMSKQALSRAALKPPRAALDYMLSVPASLAVDKAGQPIPHAVYELPKIHFGDILGSEWVIDSEEYANFVVERNSDDAWDWYSQKDAIELAEYRAGLRSEVIGEGKLRNEWEKSSPLYAVDMETYGFMKVAVELHRTGRYVPNTAFAIRGISDLARRKADLDRSSGGEIRKIAVRNALTVALDLLVAITLADVSRTP